MEWDFKPPPPWDLAELEPNAVETNLGSIIGSSSGGVGIQALDCSVDLKLGGLGDFGSAERWRDQLRVPAAVVPLPSGPSKRARAQSGNAASQNVSCLVEGCRSDLSRCREYHRRHKVCEAHSKTPIVMVAGQEQRFCQQCSRKNLWLGLSEERLRFHLLVEFDDVKRSCRKRLDGHNRRRRKPQPESISTGSIFSNHQGNMFSSYPQIFPTVAADPKWPVMVKTEDDIYTSHSSMSFIDRPHHHFPVGKHFPFLQVTDRPTTLEPSICQPLPKNIASAERSSNSSKVFDSDCALSLLSSPQQTSAINFGQIGPSGQPLLPYGGSLGFGPNVGPGTKTRFSFSGMEDEHVGGAVLVSDGSDAEMNCHVLFGVGGEGSSSGSQALPFSWQ